ncbi:hypothetical protein HMP09_0895 [Sphingomonas sp. HMP9]|nr:hypothetical protein HMP09_0895 [Sphingomonas sp. HMP9]
MTMRTRTNPGFGPGSTRCADRFTGLADPAVAKAATVTKPIIKRRISITHAFTDRGRLAVRLRSGKRMGRAMIGPDWQLLTQHAAGLAAC